MDTDDAEGVGDVSQVCIASKNGQIRYATARNVSIRAWGFLARGRLIVVSASTLVRMFKGATGKREDEELALSKICPFFGSVVDIQPCRRCRGCMG